MTRRFYANLSAFQGWDSQTLRLKKGNKTPEVRWRECFTAVRYQDVRIARVAMDKPGAQ